MKLLHPSISSRRAFMGQALVASTFMIVPRHVLGRGFIAPSDMITLGSIGCGKQGESLRHSFLTTGQAQIVAAADVFKAKVDRTTQKVNAFYAEKKGVGTYKSCEAYDDFRKILDRKDIDAVVIATPDHWHAPIAIRACKAGKDVYCEKPLTPTIHEGRAVVDAVRKHNRVFQTGSMQRSWKEFRQAVELVRNGYIGEVKTVKVNVGGPPVVFNLEGQPVPAGMNWEMWLGPNVVDRPYHPDLAPSLEYEPKIWPHWRYFKDFAGGDMADWGAHMFDIAQWGLDMDGSGPVELTPPTGVEDKGLVYKYANGIEMIHTPAEGDKFCHFIGTKGEVWVARGKLKTTPEELKDHKITAEEKHVYQSADHYMDFLNSIRSRQKPIADVEIGHRTASICNLGNIAYKLRRPLQWDPAKEKFINDEAANKQLSRPLKSEWSV